MKNLNLPPQPHYLFCDRFYDVDLRLSQFSHIRGVTLDVENVLTDGINGGSADLLPGVAEGLEQIVKLGLPINLITNCKDVDFLGEVLANVSPILGLNDGTKWDTSIPNKFSPSSFYRAARGFNVSTRKVIHFDDQIKSMIGARKARIGICAVTKPQGEFQHPGVRKFRKVEHGLIRPIVKLFPSTEIVPNK